LNLTKNSRIQGEIMEEPHTYKVLETLCETDVLLGLKDREKVRVTTINWKWGAGAKRAKNINIESYVDLIAEYLVKEKNLCIKC